MTSDTSSRPVPKVAAAGAGGGLGVAVVALLGAFGIDLPPEAAAALSTILAFAGGYAKAS